MFNMMDIITEHIPYHTRQPLCFYFSLFHEKFRTNEIIEPKMWEWKWNGTGNVKNGNLLKYKFRGFRGTYTLTLILEDGTNVPIMDDYIL